MDFAIPISQNLKKFVKSLKTRKERDESSMFTVEGNKLCIELLRSEFSVEFIVIKGNASDAAWATASIFNDAGVKVYSVRSKQFEQLCDTKSPQDIMAVVRYKSNEFNLNLSFIALDGVNDPGNLGTIIRTADWFGFRQIVISGDSVDKFNSKTVRATMGSLFRCTIITVPDFKSFLRENSKEYKLFGATLSAENKIEDIHPKGKFGLIFGSEAHGISAEIISILDKEFIIPGKGDAESLNVAVSVGISCFHFSKFI